MTPRDLEKAALVLFAAREARDLQQMKAICYVMRNRVRAGWGEGSWLTVLETADEIAAHNPVNRKLSLNERALQLLARDIDGIYFGEADGNDEIATLCGEGRGMGGERRPAPLYYCFLDLHIRDWFASHIVQDKQNHRNRGQLGFMMLFE